jgi:hypothetical protein
MNALKPALAGIKPKSLPSALLTNRFVNPVVKVREYLLLNHIVLASAPKANLYGSLVAYPPLTPNPNLKP